MSESIKHECGIVLLRLKKPLQFYKEKYGSYLYGLNKLFLLMEKQHNRGQDGCGIAILNPFAKPGIPYIHRERSVDSNSIQVIFNEVLSKLKQSGFNEQLEEEQILKEIPYLGTTYLGHLRYGTHGRGGIESCHPFIRQSNFKHRTVVMAGNFNLTNNDELQKRLQDLGQHPRASNDTVTVLEQVAYQFDAESDRVKRKLESNNLTGINLIQEIENELDYESILRNSVQEFDGGYAMCGFNGSGTSFVLRDPNSIRPAFYFEDEEIIVITSERPPIKTAFSVNYDDIKEVPGGSALIIHENGKLEIKQVLQKKEKLSCSFERIYFSRGTDRDIYLERKKLGKLLIPKVLESVNQDIENTVFSYIPNTAEVAFLGMIEGLHHHLNLFKTKKLLDGDLTSIEIEKLLAIEPRIEKIAVKDTKLRTFISSDESRGELVNHVYDTTYGIVKNYQDNLIIIDDSIVRGTTLKNSILRILDRLKPKKIVIVSSAPQIRYPDCYGIDMSKLKDFVAFRAALELLEEKNLSSVIQAVYQSCLENVENLEVENFVKKIYEPFSDEDISNKIAQMLKTEYINAEVEVIYQTVQDLHIACPEHLGDWYFTGNYPTLGGNRVSNRSFMNFYEGKNDRAY